MISSLVTMADKLLSKPCNSEFSPCMLRRTVMDAKRASASSLGSTLMGANAETPVWQAASNSAMTVSLLFAVSRMSGNELTKVPQPKTIRCTFTTSLWDCRVAWYNSQSSPRAKLPVLDLAQHNEMLVVIADVLVDAAKHDRAQEDAALSARWIVGTANEISILLAVVLSSVKPTSVVSLLQGPQGRVARVLHARLRRLENLAVPGRRTETSRWCNRLGRHQHR